MNPTFKGKLSPEQREEIRRRRKDNHELLLDLAVDFDVSESAIHYHTRDIPAPPWVRTGRPRKFDYDRAVKMYEQVGSYREVAEVFGVSHVSIRRAVRKAKGFNDDGRTVQDRSKAGGRGRRGFGRKGQVVRELVETAGRGRGIHDAGPEVGPN